jgi:hypothetical protein
MMVATLCVLDGFRAAFDVGFALSGSCDVSSTSPSGTQLELSKDLRTRIGTIELIYVIVGLLTVSMMFLYYWCFATIHIVGASRAVPRHSATAFRVAVMSLCSAEHYLRLVSFIASLIGSIFVLTNSSLLPGTVLIGFSLLIPRLTTTKNGKEFKDVRLSQPALASLGFAPQTALATEVSSQPATPNKKPQVAPRPPLVGGDAKDAAHRALIVEVP